MSAYYEDATVRVLHGDCLDVLATLPDASVDAVVTDPPYGLEFMGKEWDSFKTTGTSSLMHSPKDEGREFTNESGHMFDNTKALPRIVAGSAFQSWCELWATECLRVLKPGGHLLAFGGTRTSHRLACAVEDAGFEIRDSIAWLYGSGFPKSLDVSKAIDKAAGAEREVVGQHASPAGNKPGGASLNMSLVGMPESADITAPATDDARTWQGWGTALKPAHEPVVVARKPLVGTVAANVLAHGTGGLNVDGCRVGEPEDKKHPGTKKYGRFDPGSPEKERQIVPPYTVGRWPANVVLDESQAAALDAQSGELTSGKMYAGTRPKGVRETYGQDAASGYETAHDTPGDTGGASRFFYTAKAAASERVRINGTAHPTVKPLALMRWLVRLVTPPGGTVLEPFAGSGTTVEACILEGFRCIAIEREADYLPLITQRIHRRRDPVASTVHDEDRSLFELLDEEPA